MAPCWRWWWDCYTPFRMAFHSADCTQLISPFLCWRTFVLSQALPCYPSRLPRTKSSGPWDSFPRVPQGYASWRRTAGTWDRPQVCPTLHTGFQSDCADNAPTLRDGSLFYVLHIFHIFVIVTNREWTVGDMGETLHTPFLHQTIFYVTWACGSLFGPTHFFPCREGGCISFLISREVSAFCTAGCPLLLQPIPFPLLALWMAPLLLDSFSTSVLPSLVEDHICSYLVLERKENANLESLLLNGKTPRHCFLGFCFFFLTMLCLCCCARAFSSCSEWGLLFIAVHGLLIMVASLVPEPQVSVVVACEIFPDQGSNLCPLHWQVDS